MKILLTNDDGINAPGIVAMHRALSTPDPLGEVYAVAPLTVQSATSHGITFHTPLMVTQETINNEPCLAVDGRPADCTKLALTNLWGDKFGQGSRPDLVISGMNAGANCGINVIYSGTVAAAIEAACKGGAFPRAITLARQVDKILAESRVFLKATYPGVRTRHKAFA